VKSAYRNMGPHHSYWIEGDICKGVETVLSFGAVKKSWDDSIFGCRMGATEEEEYLPFPCKRHQMGHLIFDDLGC